MGHPPLPPPPQMRNGGSPQAHLPDPSWWLQFKWSQPPPRAPEWLFDYYERYNPPANVGRPLRDEEWSQRAFREDQQAAGLLPPGTPGGPILRGARARAERAYREWKAATDDLWEAEYEAARAHQEEAARRQRLLDEHTACARRFGPADALHVSCAALKVSCTELRVTVTETSSALASLVALMGQTHARQEAARAAQRPLHERAALERQGVAAHRQRLLDEETARLRCADQARQMAAARVIFLWHRRRRLFARLARQTSRRLQREAALARMQHEQQCCARVLQAAEHRQQAAAVRAKDIANEANQRKAAALRQRLCLVLSESVAERE